jgi:hypothetical protein
VRVVFDDEDLEPLGGNSGRGVGLGRRAQESVQSLFVDFTLDADSDSRCSTPM